MGKQTFLGDVLDRAADLDRSEGRNPQQRDGSLAYASEVYATAHYTYDVPEEAAAALAAIASGVANPWIGADGRLID